jgi:hypothetical protein
MYRPANMPTNCSTTVVALSLAVLVAGLLPACGGSSSKPTGSESGPCFSNGTCDAGLTCVSQVCVNLGGAGGAAGGSTGAAGTHGAAGETGAAGAGTAGAGGSSSLRGPKTIALSGPAHGLLWDNATSTLYLTDDTADSLLKYTDTGGVQTVGTFPSGGGTVELGDIVKRGDGTILTTSFGFGTQGTLFAMASNGTSSALTGLDASRRRSGLSQDVNGVLYDVYFVTGASPSSGIAGVGISGGAATETDLSSGFEKLIGIMATPSALFVSDQTQTTVFKIAIPGGALTTVGTPATVANLTMLPNGDLLTGGGPIVYRLTQAGVSTPAFTGFTDALGLAFDPTLKRLFVIDHDATAGDSLHIVPLDD